MFTVFENHKKSHSTFINLKLAVKQCYQTKQKCDILSNFQTMCMRRFYDNGFTEKCPFLMNAKSRICHDFFRIFFHLLTLEVKVSCIQNTLFGWISFSTSNCLVYDSFCWILLQIEVGRRAKNECFCFFSVNISLPMLCI